MKISPFFNYVAVIAEKKDKIGRIFLPTQSRMANRNIGEVVATGPGNPSATGDVIKMTAQVGDRVVYFKNGMVSELECDDGEIILLMPEANLVTKLEKEPAEAEEPKKKKE